MAVSVVLPWRWSSHHGNHGDGSPTRGWGWGLKADACGLWPLSQLIKSINEAEGQGRAHCLSCCPTPDVALRRPQGPSEGVRQEGIFGRFWYHNLSFTKIKQARESRHQFRAERPSLAALQRCRPRHNPEQILQVQVLVSQEPAHALPSFPVLSPEPHRTELLTEYYKVFLHKYARPP